MDLDLAGQTGTWLVSADATSVTLQTFPEQFPPSSPCFQSTPNRHASRRTPCSFSGYAARGDASLHARSLELPEMQWMVPLNRYCHCTTTDNCNHPPTIQPTRPLRQVNSSAARRGRARSEERQNNE